MCPGREGTDGRRQRSGRENEPTGILLYMYILKIFRDFRQISIYTGI